jgi:hypothetical protein
LKKQKRPHRAIRRKVTEADRRAREARAVERALARDAEDEARQLAVDRARAAHTPAEVIAELARLDEAAGNPALSEAESDAAYQQHDELWRQWEPTAEQVAEQRALIEQEAAEGKQDARKEMQADHNPAP